jgi:hypothetical protein
MEQAALGVTTFLSRFLSTPKSLRRDIFAKFCGVNFVEGNGWWRVRRFCRMAGGLVGPWSGRGFCGEELRETDNVINRICAPFGHVSFFHSFTSISKYVVL